MTSLMLSMKYEADIFTEFSVSTVNFCISLSRLGVMYEICNNILTTYMPTRVILTQIVKHSSRQRKSFYITIIPCFIYAVRCGDVIHSLSQSLSSGNPQMKNYPYLQCSHVELNGRSYHGFYRWKYLLIE